jgi:two-component system, LuxR family, response regulator FixJ
MSDLRAEVEPVVYVVDDDPAFGRTVAELVRSLDCEARLFESAEEFLVGVDADHPGCVILDIRLPGMDGMEVQQRMAQRDIALPVIVLTAYADTSLTVRSLRNGAVTVLDKPFRREDLTSSIREAVRLSQQEYRRRRHLESLESRLRTLTAGDRTVLRLMLEGHKNRSIARRLEVSLRTVENRRRHVFTVMQATSVAQLTRMVVEYEHHLLPREDLQESWLRLPFERVAS